MANILVVIGSARLKRTADTVLPFVLNDLKARDGIETVLADLKEIKLPFVDTPIPPASPDFVATDKAVIGWTKLVDEADGVIFITPEYNHAITAIQKNAIDWIMKEWNDKPVGLIGYGWGGGEFSLEDARRVLEFVGAKPQPTITQLFFNKQLAVDGSVIDSDIIKASIKATIDELVAIVER